MVPTTFPITIDGERIRLREVNLADLDASWSWASHEEFFRFLPFEQPDREEQLSWLQSVVDESRAVPRRQFQLGIEIVETGVLIGMARLGIESDQHRNASLGYGIHPDYWGQGFATEATRLLLDFGFTILGMHRIWATHHPDNDASRRVLDKAGLREEGRLRDDRLVDGVWYDSVVCSILDTEWRAGRHH